MDRLSDSIRGELSRFGAQGRLGEIVGRWPSAVGDAIARNAWPARIGRDGTLYVNTADSVWAFELSHRAREIAGRLEVDAIRFVPGPLPGAETPPVQRKGLEPSLEEAREAARIAAEMGDPELREKIQRAVALALAKRRSDRPI
jgi:hypothetical protein